MIAAGKRSQASTEAGFTLLEMIVAVTLVALMAVGLWAAFRISIRSWSRGTEFIDTNQRHRTVLDMVRKQIASTYPLFTPVDLRQTLAQGGVLSGMQVSHVIFNGIENSMLFVSLNSLQFQESPGLTIVYYGVTQNSVGSFSLIEKEDRYTGQVPEVGAMETLPRATSVFENLSSCAFEYFDPGVGDNPARWVKEWDGQEMGRLPVAISMSMTFHDSRGSLLNRHMVVPIQAQAGNFANPINPFGRRTVLR